MPLKTTRLWFRDFFRLRDQKTSGAMAPVAPPSSAPLYIYLLQVNSVMYIHILIHRYDQANVRVIFKPLFNQIVWLDWLQLKCPCSMDKEILNIYSQNSIIGRHANYMMIWSMNWKQLLGRLTNSMRREPTKPMRLIQIFLNVLYPFKLKILSINWFWNTEFWDPTFKWIFISAAPVEVSNAKIVIESVTYDGNQKPMGFWRSKIFNS